MYLGHEGTAWSASAIDHYYGLNLDFHTMVLLPNSASRRAYGFQLRCLSE
ncbi:hypothetical protein [uncultured Rikenella sp.]|nr:hypothetical protein [uncultured Rikenella sp.]